MTKDYRPKTQYIHEDEPEYYDFKGNPMIKIAIKVNPETGYGKAMSMGVAKAQGLTTPKNIIALKRFAKEHEDKLKTISDTAHLKKEGDGGQQQYGNEPGGYIPPNEEEIPF